MKIANILLIIVLLISGCAHSLNQINANKYYNAGEEAVANGDLILADKMYCRALINSKSGYMEPDIQSQIYMKLGRINGSLCKYSEAEKYFLDILDLYKKNQKTQSKYIFIATLELGQFYYDIGQYGKATKYFAKVFDIYGNDLKNLTPVAYYEILIDYRDALMKTNKQNKAKEVNKILKNNPQFLKEKSGYVRYPRECN